MKKQLFFDDNQLFARDNLTRKYGKAKLASTYSDGISSTDFATGFVFRLDNGKFRMLYFGHSQSYQGRKLLSAISDDGILFLPEHLKNEDKENQKLSHEVMSLPRGFEVACIYEDLYCTDRSERYKLLMSEHKPGSLEVRDVIYVSNDLLNWLPKNGVAWGDGAEPLASVFYNKHKKVHTIIERQFWGIRSAGYKETKDWEEFSEYADCLNVDSNDERLSEIYGMYAFEYEGMYIGLPHIYRGLHSELNAKYKGGIIDTQLAYSYDGRYWRRSLREPFLSGLTEYSKEEVNYNLIWVSSVLKGADEKIRFYTSVSELEHGPAFHKPGTGKIQVYEIRKDGFISLATENENEPSVLATREKVWHGGELHVNLIAQKATVAVYISDKDEHVSGLNVLGLSRPIDGYGHEDCIEFCGDCTNWIPQYKTGKRIDELKGKTLVFELRFKKGEVFSLSGDYTNVFNTQAAIYRKYGVLPKDNE